MTSTTMIHSNLFDDVTILMLLSLSLSLFVIVPKTARSQSSVLSLHFEESATIYCFDKFTFGVERLVITSIIFV